MRVGFWFVVLLVLLGLASCSAAPSAPPAATATPPRAVPVRDSRVPHAHGPCGFSRQMLLQGPQPSARVISGPR